MKDQIKEILLSAEEELKSVTNETELLLAKAKLLGKKSKFAELLTSIKEMNNDERKNFGRLINDLKYDLEQMIRTKSDSFATNELKDFDISFPVNKKSGSLHPITIVAKEVTDILRQMGFIIFSGPEIESEYYNFEALNIPKNHPARDMHDTFYLNNSLLLRTHTSTNQIRGIEKYGVPLRICGPGRCFRNENIDHSHDSTFFQLEGMVIDKNISIGNFVYVMKQLLTNIFKKEIKVRLRPGFFPFTEPSFELDCSCLICGGQGCPTCKGSGWIELCPGGMVHPNVLRMSGIDPKEYNGFAFGLGLTRLAMMKYKIDDIRILNSGDLSKLEMFNIR